MTAARVDSVIAAVERHDPELASWMRAAADSLTAGEGEELISQASLQGFLWYDLPRKLPSETWQKMVEAAGVLLALLGLDRYAAIARSPATATILEAWGRAPAKGFPKFKAARAASGVEPPDTELLEWGGVMGFAELGAAMSVEAALERAIVAGDLQPGKAAWRRVAIDICTRTLLAPADDTGGVTRLQSVLDERTDTWIRMARPAALQAWREQARALWAREPQPPDVTRAVAPMRWLLETCRPGVTLTQAGYLPPAVARDAADRFGWWEWPGQPRSEADVHQLGGLRGTATRLHLVSMRARRLGLTRRGRDLVDDPVGLWRAIASTLACEDTYLAMLSELVAHRLLDGPAVDDALGREIAPVIVEQGWMAGRERVTTEQAAGSVHRALYDWRLCGLLDEVHPRWEGGHQTVRSSTSLNPLGRSTAIEFLRARATAARADLHT